MRLVAKKRKNSRWHPVAAAGVAMTVALAGSVATSAPSWASSSPSGNLTWFFWTGSPGETAVWQHNTSLVSQAYPNLHVSLVTTSWTDYWSKLPIEASTHSMPCLAGLQYGYTGADGNLFIPLNSFVQKYHYSLKPFETTMIRELSDNGNLLALPYDFGPVVIAYNEDLFKQKHVAMPRDGWTWSQFMSDAKALTGGGTYGYLPAVSLELAYDLTGTPDAYVQGGKFDLANPAFEKGVQLQAALDYQDHLTPAYSEAPNWATTEFDSGKVAMEVNGPWSLIDFKGQSSFPVGWVEFPATATGMHTYNEGSGFGITKDCADPTAAWKALTVLVDQQALAYAGARGRAFPAWLADDNLWTKFAGGNAGNVMETALAKAQAQEVTTNWTAFQTALTKYEPLVLNGQISAAKFATEVQTASGAGAGIAPGNLTSILGG